MNEELRALFAIEQLLNKIFKLPVLIGDFEDTKIPRYFIEQERTFVDCRMDDETKNFDELTTLISNMAEPKGKIFIGHGRSPVWKDLKDFVKDRLNLEYEEFNREPAAGKSNKERLLE